MKLSTLEMIRCLDPECATGELTLAQGARFFKDRGEDRAQPDVEFGDLSCVDCGARYPVLAGVALIVPDVEGYLLEHIQGVAAVVREGDFPKELRKSLQAAAREAREAGEGHIEEGLESDRVNALYLMNHYLSGAQVAERLTKTGDLSQVIKKMITDFWDTGPMSRVAARINSNAAKSSNRAAKVVELGCGVGGVLRALGVGTRSAQESLQYLGVDSSFLSIWHARRLNRSQAEAEAIAAPGDLIHGPQTLTYEVATLDQPNDSDFIVGQIDLPPIRAGIFDWSLSLNTIDMLDDPSRLAEAQWQSLKSGGHAIQSCPYIWHPAIARQLREWAQSQSADQKSSSALVGALYQSQGFEIVSSEEHIAWLFLKHARQLEIYDVHLLEAKKG
jgi:SAM-dependent methyltransferase